MIAKLLGKVKFDNNSNKMLERKEKRLNLDNFFLLIQPFFFSL